MVVQPPKWTKKHSFVTLFTLISIFFLATVTAVGIGDGPSGSVVIQYYGIPLTWFRGASNTLGESKFYPLNLVFDVGLSLAITTLIVYYHELGMVLEDSRGK